MNEIWMPVLGYEDSYSVSNIGNVRSETRMVRHHMAAGKKLTGKLLTPQNSTFGYLVVTLCKENIKKKHSVHRLVLQAFSNRSGEGLDACHTDGDRINNNISNLKWGTRTENMQDCIKHGKTNRGSKNPNCKLNKDQVLAIRSDKRKQSVVASEYGINQSTVSDIQLRKLWSYL